MSLLVVGSIAFDDLELPSGRFPDTLGGSATHCGYAASLFTRCGLVAVVGDDFPGHLLGALRRRGIDTAGVRRAAGPTFRWAGRYPPTFLGRETLKTELGVFSAFDPDVPEEWRTASTVFLGNISPALQNRVLDQVRRPRFSAVDTMNFWIRRERDELERVARRVHCIFVNDEEILEWTGRANIFDGIDDLHARGPRVVVVKRGEHGAWLSVRGRLAFAPVFPVREVVDPTGAGDAFAGGFLGFIDRRGRTDNPTLRRALGAAAAVASLAVERVGAGALARITPAEVARRERTLRSLVGR